MTRRLLVAALLTASPLLPLPAAHAGPPYCADVSDSNGTAARVCAIGTGCAVYGGGLDQGPAAFRFCRPWP